MPTTYGKIATTESEKAANRSALISSLSELGTSAYDANGNVVIGTRQPTPSVVTTPTTNSIKRSPGLLENARRELAEAEAGRSAARAEAESFAARQRQIRIDAINEAFAPRIIREKEEAQARLSRVAALNFRSGVVGSGVDTTKTGEQKNLNEKSLQAIEAERASAIEEVFGWADELATKKASEIYEESKSGAEADVTRYSALAEEARSRLDVLGAQGVDAKSLKEVDPRVYETLRDVSGMSDASIDAYLKAKAPEGIYHWDAAEISGSSMYVPKVLNGKVTMEKVDLGFTPKQSREFKTAVKTDDGVLVIFGDGTYDVIGGSSSGVRLKPGAPSWEEYLAAAENEAQMNFSNESRAKLREKYDSEFVLTDVSDFAPTERRRLEQADLLSSSRKEQLDFLYGQDEGGLDFSLAE